MNLLNKNGHVNFNDASTFHACGASSRQAGVVLFFALIALVVMSLAAVALIRSVDTNTLIAGNLAFKQSAIVSADSGLETAIKWLSDNQGVLDVSNQTDGYYADPINDPKDRFNTGYRLAIGQNISAGVDSSGNMITYVIERMCIAGTVLAAVVPEEKCLVGAPSTSPGSQAVKTYGNSGGAPSSQGANPMYRVTVRVAGPRNTLAFTQAFVY